MSENETLPPDMQPVRALGYKRDPEDPRDFQAERLLGAPARADLIVPASMREYVVGTYDQRNAGSCVGWALTRAIDMALRARAKAAGLPADEIPMGSPGFIYAIARQRENVERGTKEPLADVGSFPRLAMKAVRALGVCPDAAYPYPIALQHINAHPPPSAFQHAFDMRNMQYYRISQTGRARVASIARALAQSCPVILGMFVDRGFMACRGEPITTINANDPDGGGHMLTVVSVDQDFTTVSNSWGAGWGEFGFGRIANDIIGGPLVTDVYAITTAAPFSG